MKTQPLRKQDRQVVLDKFYSLLGLSMTKAGFTEDSAGMVLIAVMKDGGNIQTNYAYNPDTGKGVMWGRSSGGAVRLPFPLEDVTAAVGIDVFRGDSRPMGYMSSVLIRPKVASYWVLAFNHDYLPQVVSEDDPADVGEHLLAQAVEAEIDWSVCHNKPPTLFPPATAQH